MNGEPFVRVPLGVFRAHESGELSGLEFKLVAWSIYRSWRDRGPTTFTLAMLKDEARLDETPDGIRKALRRCGEPERGWLAVDAPGQGAGRWTVRLTPKTNLDSTSDEAPPTESEDTSDGPKSDDPPNPDDDFPFGNYQPQTGRGSTEQSRAEERTATAAAEEDFTKKTATLEITVYEVEQLIDEVRGGDEKTGRTIMKHAHGLPPAAIACVREALKERRGRIRNEAGYVVGYLKKLQAGEPWT